MSEDQIKIELTQDQQAIEDSRHAKEVLENPIFKRVYDDYVKTFDEQLMNLEPEDKDAFPIIQSPRKYLKLFYISIQRYIDAHNVKSSDRGLVS